MLFQGPLETWKFAATTAFESEANRVQDWLTQFGCQSLPSASKFGQSCGFKAPHAGERNKAIRHQHNRSREGANGCEVLSRFSRSLKPPTRAESLAEFRPSGVCKSRTPPHVRFSFANVRAGCRSAPMGRSCAGTENMRRVVCICVTQLPTHVTASPDRVHLGMKGKIEIRPCAESRVGYDATRMP